MDHLFAWYELMTTDLDGAAAFYAQVTGWQAKASPMAPPGMDYRLFAPANAMPSAGMMELPAGAKAMGVPPNWLGYVATPDAAASLAKAVALGGAVAVPVTEIPNVCHFACFTDPQGAAIGLMQPINPPPDMKPDYAANGRFAWHELYVDDVPAALAFYGALFGWVERNAMDMGPMGTYQFYGTAEQVLGGIMTRQPQVPVCCWNYYSNVADIDAAVAAINAGGGLVLFGPQQVPGGGWIVNARDPQGAVFALVGGRK
jgi:hypothetical protein